MEPYAGYEVTAQSFPGLGSRKRALPIVPQARADPLLDRVHQVLVGCVRAPLGHHAQGMVFSAGASPGRVRRQSRRPH